MAADDLVQLELTLNRFRKLLGEIQFGATTRNNFEPWEIEILLDMETCPMQPRRRVETLRQYQKAVERQLESGSTPPMKLSEFLAMRKGSPGKP